MVRIRNDEKGLFIVVDGWIARPAEKTILVKGEDVSATHPAGSTAYVKKKPGKKFKPELWDIMETRQDYFKKLRLKEENNILSINFKGSLKFKENKKWVSVESIFDWSEENEEDSLEEFLIILNEEEYRKRYVGGEYDG